jgi:hypothetical protein
MRALALIEALGEHRALGASSWRASTSWRDGRGPPRGRAPSRSAGSRRATPRDQARASLDLRLLARAGVIDGATRSALVRKLRAHRRRYGFPVAVEMDDLHKANFMLRERDGDLRYVDEEGVAVRPLLTSLASLVKTADRKEHWEAFRAGYARVSDASAITPEYTEYVVLVDTARKVANKVRSANRLDDARLSKLPAEIEDLRRVAHRETPDLDFGFYRGPV